MSAKFSRGGGGRTFFSSKSITEDPFEHVNVFDSESDLLVPQCMSQLVMRPEFTMTSFTTAQIYVKSVYVC